MKYAAAPLRREELLRRLDEAGYISSSATAIALGVSEMTIRRDLAHLADAGLARRVTGGASAVGESALRPFDLRRGEAAAEKEAIARATVALLDGARTIALDAGTTVAAVAHRLPALSTVVTHSVPAILTCSGRADLTLIGLGGDFHAQTRSFTGPATRAGMADIAVDVALLSAAAVGPSGAFSADTWDAGTKRAMVAAADRVLLLVDHHKFAARAPMRFLDLERADAIVTDDGIDPGDLAMLRERCAVVVVAERS